MKRSVIGFLAVLVLVTGAVGISLVRSTTASAAVVAAASPTVSANDQDADQVEEQVGDQNQADDDNEAAEVDEATEAPDPGETGEAAETADQAEPAITGSISVTDPEPSDLSTLAKITAAQAEAAALATSQGATVAKTELDNENGFLVYSVELSNGTEVKVDAGDGTILSTEAGGPEDERGGAADESGETPDAGADVEDGD